jgi:hypothetical protein
MGGTCAYVDMHNARPDRVHLQTPSATDLVIGDEVRRLSSLKFVIA